MEELRVVAEELREERERLEWTATQVAHLVEHRRGPSLDPDPTPPAPLEVRQATTEAAAGDDGAAPATGTTPEAPTVVPGRDA